MTGTSIKWRALADELGTRCPDSWHVQIQGPNSCNVDNRFKVNNFEYSRTEFWLEVSISFSPLLRGGGYLLFIGNPLWFQTSVILSKVYQPFSAYFDGCSRRISWLISGCVFLFHDFFFRRIFPFVKSWKQLVLVGDWNVILDPNIDQGKLNRLNNLDARYFRDFAVRFDLVDKFDHVDKIQRKTPKLGRMDLNR